MKKITWSLWIFLTLAIGSYFAYTLLIKEDKSQLLIGETSHGHYQIELACSSCHTEAFGGEEVIQNACVNCHAEELEQAHDSHPKKKFTDPREAYRLEIIDARYCISCHTEHQEEQTHAMGVTLPDDYCYHCHKEISDERESHKDLAFDSCASAGCHNFHDNRALYESFLVQHANKPWLDDIARISAPSNAALSKAQNPVIKNESIDQQYSVSHPEITQHWSATSHAQAGVSCSGCHTTENNSEWIERPALQQCQQCHQQEAEGFLASKHGMRLSPKLETQLPAVRPMDSPMDFKHSSLNAQHGCNSCHAAHEFNTQFAATEACLTCHNDEHSLAFKNSPHGKLWQSASLGDIDPENAVSCATCHLPRVADQNTGIKIVNKNNKEGNSEREINVRVEHNQNFYLRPNEKMIRPVCMQCHSLEFSIDALADETLIKNNFSGKLSKHIPSIDWALKREVDK